jgi:hypothetical protein
MKELLSNILFLFFSISISNDNKIIKIIKCKYKFVINKLETKYLLKHISCVFSISLLKLIYKLNKIIILSTTILV